MDQRQTQQTEQIIAEMLDFLETSSEEEHDLDQQTEDTCNGADIPRRKDLNHIIAKNMKSNMKTKNELKKLRNQALCNSKETEINSEVKHLTDGKIDSETQFSAKFDNLEWQFKLENHCRRSYNNTYTQEVYKAIYQNTTGHPRSGSADYYQAAQNYVLYGKSFLDFPQNMQMLLNGLACQGSAAESSNLIPNFGSCLYSKANIMTPNITIAGSVPSTAATTAAYYQILNNMQAQSRSALAANPGNSTAYGIFMGNKVTYVAGTPTTPSLIYNQHNTTTTNFISNSLANAALATSPTILYTNPLLTTTTQQYLTQFLSAAALTSNSMQSTTVSANAGGGGSVYERLIYAQMLQQQLYQTQQATSMPAMFQNKHRVVNQVARQTSSALNANNNRSSPQHLTAAPLPCSSNGITFSTCYRQARSTSPKETAALKLKTSEISEKSKISSA